MRQITDKIVMIRPANFGFNPDTAESNRFQRMEDGDDPDMIKQKALEEFDDFVEVLRDAGIRVIVFEDTADPVKSDAVFPNNWFTTHQDGSIITYPMLSENRRLERSSEIIKSLMDDFGFEKTYHFEHYESEGKYLEGTGSMILDRENRIVYACVSARTDLSLIDKFCVLKQYNAVFFSAVDKTGAPVYHTNVILSVGEEFAIICSEMIKEDDEKKKVIKALEESGKELIEISESQVNMFAGNVLQLSDSSRNQYIIMSEQARESLYPDQLAALSQYGEIISAPLYTIEKYGGGSARCMMAEVFIP